MGTVQFKFYRDRHNGQLHCWNGHQVTAQEVKEAFLNATKQYKDESAYMRQGKTKAGRLLEIVFDWVEPNQKVFVITAYDI